MSSVKKGQKVWVSLRRGIKETIVKSVGSKYITLEYDPRIKFDKDTLKEVDSCGLLYFIILDLEKYETDRYYSDLISKLGNFEWNTIKREDLDKVAEIISHSS